MAERLVTAAWVVLSAMRTQARAMRGSQLAILLGAVQPMVLLVVLAGAAPAGGRTPLAAGHLVAGVGMTALWGSTIWTAGGILRGERVQGTLPALVTGVRSAYLVLFGKSLAATIRLTGIIGATIVVAALVLRLPVRIASPFWLAAGVLAVIACGTALGMLLATIFLVTRHGQHWASALMYPVFIMGGMLIPGELLPAALHWVPAVVPMHWAQRFLTSAMDGTAPLFPLLMLAGMSAGYFLLAAGLFSRVIDLARSRGTLELS